MKKKLLLSSLFIILLTTGYLYQNQLKTLLKIEEPDLSSRSFFKAQETPQNVRGKLQAYQSLSTNILTYKLTHHLKAHQNPTDHNQKKTVQESKITALCNIQPSYDRNRDIFEIAVDFFEINRHTGAPTPSLQQTEHRRVLNEKIDAAKYGGKHTISPDGKSIEGEIPQGSFHAKERSDPFFLVKVEGRSGKILSLQAEDGYEEDPLMNSIAEHLISDIMPEVRQEAYKNRVQQEDNLGKIAVKYSLQNLNSNEYLLHKNYNHNDYSQSHLGHLKHPNMNYQRTVNLHKNTGIAHKGSSTFTFSHGQQQKLQFTQGAHLGAEALGEFSGHIKFDFENISPKENSTHLKNEIWRYRHQMTFHNVPLSHELKASVKYGNGQHEPFSTKPFIEPDQEVTLPSGQPDYHYPTSSLQSPQQQQEILEQDEGKLQQFSDYTNIFGNIKVVDPKISPEELKRRIEADKRARERNQNLINISQYHHTDKLASLNILGNQVHVDYNYFVEKTKSVVRVDAMLNSHVIANIIDIEWENCKQDVARRHFEKDFTLFEATFPLLGIIVIPVEAKVKLEYGYDSRLNTGLRLCEFDFRPYFKGSLFADGKISVFHFIEAGIYTQGTFLDTQLDFKIGSDHGRSYTNLTGQFTGFTLSIGATYTKFHCSIDKAWSRRVLQEEEKEQNDGQNRMRRALWPHWSFVHKVVHAVKRVSAFVDRTVKRVNKVVHNLATKGIVGTFCDKSMGYKQLYSHSSPTHSKTFFNHSVNVGI